MQPAKLFRYFGGKYYLVPDIFRVVEYAPRPVKIFVDVFGGSGTVFVSAPRYIRGLEVVVYNDISKALYRTVKVLVNEEQRKKVLERLEYALRHYDFFKELAEWYKTTDGDDDTTDDVEVAFRVLYLSAYSHSADMRTFGMRTLARDDVGATINNILDAVRTLRTHAVIENMDFRDIIRKWDGPNTLFYLDPPYITSGEKYNHDFTEDDLRELAEILAGIKGMYVLNESDKDFGVVRKYFGEPTYIGRYFNTITHNSYREEGFWTNFRERMPKQTTLTGYYQTVKNNAGNE